LRGTMHRRPKLGCRFYRTDSGNEPVRDWLRGLPAEIRKAIGDDIRFVQWAWPIGKPLVDGLGAGLHEVRSFHDGCAYRVLFGVERGAMILLHGFQKKTARTPRPDLELARGRLRGSR